MNFFKNTYEVVDSLSSLPRLGSLSINLNEEEQVDYIMKKLPALEFLNGLEVERDDEEEEEEESEEEAKAVEAAKRKKDADLGKAKEERPERAEIELDELESVAILYDAIRNIHKKRSPERDQELARDFDQHLQRVMKTLSQSVQNSNAPQNVKTVNGFKAKYDLYDI